jgi:DNA-binding NarL/FixJ family response regulator
MSSPKAMEKFRILIVDDGVFFRKALMERLQTSFPAVAIHEVADGGEALREVDAFLPDLIFMDIKLSGENGLELTKKIKAAHPDMIIFIITSYDLFEYRDAASRYGANHFLAKASFNWRELQELVRSYQKVQKSRSQSGRCESNCAEIVK